MPYIRDETLQEWITFPSEQLRRAYVQAASAIRAAHPDIGGQTRHLSLLAQACDGVRQDTEPKSE